jgi:hypothetical protein
MELIITDVHWIGAEGDVQIYAGQLEDGRPVIFKVKDS